VTLLAVEGPVALQDAVDGTHGRQRLDTLAREFVVDGLGTVEAQVAVLPQVLPQLEDQGFEVRAGTARVVGRLGSVGPIDAVEAKTVGAAQPAQDGSWADAELEGDLVERGPVTHSSYHGATTLG
jgi:hypothetical protein